ncbi:VOC family protein [Paenibacillus lycopersici]|uniref:VOC family protein n=2 Tax=Paenibacillus lycopersici TaxID=2704462 RepID=A0A6C0FNU6_9BACL|nr:VOC family protein [Paenibacillus lycopersici]
MSDQTSIRTPIKPIIPAVFVSVTDVKASTAWYCRLLGLPVPDTVRTDIHIFSLQDRQCSNLFLRRADKAEPTSQPLFSLTSPDIEATQRFLAQLNVEVVYRDEEVIWFRDPDGNVLMACAI